MANLESTPLQTKIVSMKVDDYYGRVLRSATDAKENEEVWKIEIDGKDTLHVAFPKDTDVQTSLEELEFDLAYHDIAIEFQKL